MAPAKSETTAGETTIIGRDTVIKGEMSFESNAKILGRFEGLIRASGEIEIGNGSNVEAQIDAERVVIDGEITGDLIARDRMTLSENAVVNGDITAGTLIVSEGASFLGHCRVGPAAVAAAEKAPEIGSKSVTPAPRANNGVIASPEVKPAGRPPVVIDASKLEPSGVGASATSGEQLDPEFRPPWKNDEDAKRSA